MVLHHPCWQEHLGEHDEGNVQIAKWGKDVANHSLRAYGAKELFRRNVLEKCVQQITRDSQLQALRKCVTETQVIDVCSVLEV